MCDSAVYVDKVGIALVVGRTPKDRVLGLAIGVLADYSSG
jgi:hypothetical protein